MKLKTTLGGIVVALSALFATVPALAGTVINPGPPCGPGDPGRGGLVAEHSFRPNATFVIHITDASGALIPGRDYFPKTIPDGHGGSTIVPFNVPVQAGNCDAFNTTTFPVANNGAGGPQSQLRIEAYAIDPVSGKYVLYNIWDSIAAQVGTGTPVLIPDLYATDVNGVPLDGVTLYSLVDLTTFIPAHVTFTEGQKFTVIGGQVAGLTDMIFSTTPFVFDSTNGFTGSPYSGGAEAISEHSFTSVPEPSTWALMLTGFAGLGGMLRRRLTSRYGSRATLAP